VDWREILYRMAYDNSRASAYIEQLTLAMNKGYYPYKTGAKLNVPAKCYYYDADEKSWKHPVLEMTDKNTGKSIEYLQEKGSMIFGIPAADGSDADLFMSSTHIELIDKWQNTWNTGYDYCYADMLAFWRLVYDNRSISEIEKDNSLTDSEKEDRIKRHNEWFENKYWHPDIIYC